MWCQLNAGVSSDNVKVDTSLTVIREVHARWISARWIRSGITDACRSDFKVDDNPFADLV